jgi:hypothetical protein
MKFGVLILCEGAKGSTNVLPNAGSRINESPEKAGTRGYAVYLP